MKGIKALATVPAQRTRAATVLAMAGLGLAACSTNQGPPRPVAMVPAAPVSVIAPAAHNRIVPDDVAAPLCGSQTLRDDYNRILKTHRNLLNEAYSTEQARYRQQHGTAGQARHDVAMTRLYNGFSSVPDRRRFCTQASRVADELLAVPSADVPRIAARALTAMEPGAMRLVSSAY